MFIPGYVENWIVVLDLDGSGLFDTSFQVYILMKTNRLYLK